MYEDYSNLLNVCEFIEVDENQQYENEIFEKEMSIVNSSEEDHEVQTKKSRRTAKSYKLWKEFRLRNEFGAFWSTQKIDWRLRHERELITGVNQYWNCIYNQRSNKGTFINSF